MALDDLLKALKKNDPARLKRLEELGFDTSKIYFHGSPRSDISEFVPGKSGKDMYGEGVYFTTEPSYASDYANMDLEEVYSRNKAENPKFGAFDNPGYNKEWGNTVYPVFLKKPDFSVNEIANKSVKKNFIESLLKRKSEFPDQKFKDTLNNANRIENNYNLLNLMRENLYADETSKVLQDSGVSTAEIPSDMALVVKNPDENIKSIWAKGLQKKGLLTGAGAVPTMQNPLEMLGDVASNYRKAQNKAADYVYEQITPKSIPRDEMMKESGRMALDPINLVEGPLGFLLNTIMMAPEAKK